MGDIGLLLGIILLAGCVIYYSLYYIVKKATKDALKEYFEENEKEI